MQVHNKNKIKSRLNFHFVCEQHKTDGESRNLLVLWYIKKENLKGTNTDND